MTQYTQAGADLESVLKKATDIDRESQRRRLFALLAVFVLAVSVPVAAAIVTYHLKNEASAALTQAREAERMGLRLREQIREDSLKDERIRETIRGNEKKIREQEERIAQLKDGTAGSAREVVDIFSNTIQSLEPLLSEKSTISRKDIRAVIDQINHHQKAIDQVNAFATAVAADSQTVANQREVAQLAAALKPDKPPVSNIGPSPTPNASAAGRIQFLMGGPPESRGDRERKIQELESYFHDEFGYDRETGRADINRAPPSLEVRYYHYPEDRGEAEKVLSSLREKEHLGPTVGRVSYVIDPDQPRHTFQVAFPK